MSFTDVLLTDSVRGLKLLKEDPLFSKLDGREQMKAIQMAEQMGKEASSWLRKTYKNMNLSDILKQLEVQVIYENVPCSRLSPYSIYRPKTKTITIHQNIIEQLTLDIEKYSDIQGNRFEKLINIILYHELFHHLEEVQFGSASKLLKVKVANFGLFDITSGIRALSEIGAHIFTRDCIGEIDKYLHISTKEVIQNGF